MDPLAVTLALRVITQVGLTIEQLAPLFNREDPITEEEVAAILAQDREAILENIENNAVPE